MQREDIRNSLIVSCQPVPGGPMDRADFVAGFAKAALKGGAEIDTIRAALGHSNVAVTQRYCGQEMHLENPACEKLGL